MATKEPKNIGINIEGDQSKTVKAMGELVMNILECESAEQETKRVALKILPEAFIVNIKNNHIVMSDK